MELTILYIIFSGLYSFGIDIYKEKPTIGNFIFSMLFGWLLLPTSLGTKRGKELDDK